MASAVFVEQQTDGDPSKQLRGDSFIRLHLQKLLPHQPLRSSTAAQSPSNGCLHPSLLPWSASPSNATSGLIPTMRR